MDLPLSPVTGSPAKVEANELGGPDQLCVGEGIPRIHRAVPMAGAHEGLLSVQQVYVFRSPGGPFSASEHLYELPLVHQCM